VRIVYSAYCTPQMMILITTNCIIEFQAVSANAQVAGRMAVKLLPYAKAAANAAITTLAGLFGLQTYNS